MIKLIATAGIATLLTGCVVAPDAGYGYGYGQTYYPNSGYVYGPTYPSYGTINIWSGGGRDRDGGRGDFRRGDRDHDRGDHDRDRGGRRGDWNDWRGGGHGHGDRH